MISKCTANVSGQSSNTEGIKSYSDFGDFTWKSETALYLYPLDFLLLEVCPLLLCIQIL